MHEPSEIQKIIMNWFVNFWMWFV